MFRLEHKQDAGYSCVLSFKKKVPTELSSKRPPPHALETKGRLSSLGHGVYLSPSTGNEGLEGLVHMCHQCPGHSQPRSWRLMFVHKKAARICQKTLVLKPVQLKSRYKPSALSNKEANRPSKPPTQGKRHEPDETTNDPLAMSEEMLVLVRQKVKRLASP